MSIITPFINRQEREVGQISINNAIIFLQTNNHTIKSVIAIGSHARTCSTLCGVQYRDIKVAILIATPSPINMVEATAIGTIEHKLVSAI